ncbi:hypothetical protein C0585_01165 [Candidatus Woesearchaeota archaeon]|nr:MAG: hypothetical protein C0585_01165 [Candidatus Woesearchaeota archaeon]
MLHKKKTDPYKIATITLGIILLLTLGYVGITKYNNIQFQKYQDIYVQGYNKGVEDSVVKLFSETDDCKVTSIFIGNTTRQIADLECINKVLSGE